MDYAIIAAGEGSRLVQEGVKWPKPLVQLNGTALIDRLINVFLKNDASSISIIVNEEMTEVQEHLRKLELPYLPDNRRHDFQRRRVRRIHPGVPERKSIGRVNGSN